MKNTTLSAAVALVLGSVTMGAQAVTLTFSNSTTAGVAGTDFNYSACNVNFLTAREFRMCDPTGALGGGIPLQKDVISGGETWGFTGSDMTSVSGTGAVGALATGVTSYIDMNMIDPSADRDGATLGLHQGADFFGNGFNFLAPVLGSEANTAGSPAANDIGIAAGQYTVTGANTFEIFFEVLEAHWAGAHFMLGQAGGAGITFYGTTDGTNFSMWAQETIDASEDKTNAGFAGWTAQWYMVGTIDGFEPPVSEVPVPAAAWLLGSGLIGLVGVARRRKAA